MISYNGDILDEKELTIPFLNRAFLYGDGFFESIFIHSDKMPLWHLHAERIKNAAEILQFQNINILKVLESIENLTEVTKGSFKRARISFFRENGGLYTPTSRNAEFVIEIKPIAKDIKALPTDGITLGISSYQKAVQPFGSFKSLNSQLYVLAGIEKQKLGFDELILFNHYHAITECISSNIFWFENEELFTPSLKTGCVNGVMRKHVLEVCKKQGIKVYEVETDLPHSVSEMFLTNAIQGIVPVKSINNEELRQSQTRYLHQLVW
ncbi:MAG: aminotransferase class IV [Bacteroidetes bacterium]|nr:aminotransferase class IV [Bacteroidota bacterium]